MTPLVAHQLRDETFRGAKGSVLRTTSAQPVRWPGPGRLSRIKGELRPGACTLGGKPENATMQRLALNVDYDKDWHEIPKCELEDNVNAGFTL